MKKEWYVVNTISGHEYKVKEKLENRINSMDLGANIFRVVVPEQKEIEYKDGVKKKKKKKMFPGYVLVEMIMSDEAWFIVRNTQGVTGFIGSSGKGAKPIPLLPQEVDRVLGAMGMSRIDISKDIKVGNKVGITTILVNPVSKSDFVLTKIHRFKERRMMRKLRDHDLFWQGRYYD